MVVCRLHCSLLDTSDYSGYSHTIGREVNQTLIRVYVNKRGGDNKKSGGLYHSISWYEIYHGNIIKLFYINMLSLTIVLVDLTIVNII